MDLKRKRTNEKEVDAGAAVSVVSILANENFTGASAETLQTGNASALPGSERGNVTAQSRPMDSACTTSAVPLTEGHALSAAMLPIMNESKQHFFETLRQQQCSYAMDYDCKHGR